MNSHHALASIEQTESSSLSFPSLSRILFTSLVALVSCFALLAFLSSSFPSTDSSSSSLHYSIKTTMTTTAPTARPLKKLSKPVVILVSCDGFRFGYQFKTPTPNIHRLIESGTEAETGLIPVFPSYTFPNHYSIATGLYPDSHGIINNRFVDPHSGEKFTKSNHDPKWWLGEPLWVTAANHGLKAATYFWPGSEVHKGSWNCPDGFCIKYNESVPFEERVDTILSYFDLPGDQIPELTALYFEDPDAQGHLVGPDHLEITKAVSRMDKLIGRLIQGLEKRGVFEEVSFILLGDHGMVGTCESKVIFLEDLAPWVKIPADWVQSYSPLLAILPPDRTTLSRVVKQMNRGLKKIKNGKSLRVYLKEDLPKRLQYSASDRIAPIIGLLDEGYMIGQRKTEGEEYCGGAHGYDNQYFSMRTIFVGHGPRFGQGRKVPSFQNLEVYNVITSILGIEGAPNNGSASFPRSILLPYEK